MPKSDFFAIPHLLSIIIVTPPMVLLVVAHLQPSAVPYAYLGPLGSLVKYLLVIDVLKYLFHFLWTAHLSEACYCLHLCVQKNISLSSTVKWIIATLVFGIFSLHQLIAYDSKLDLKLAAKTR